MNRIVLDKEEVITIIEDVEFVVKEEEEKVIYLNAEKGRYHLSYQLGKNSRLQVFHYSIDASFEVEVHLQGEGAEISYFFSTINERDNDFICSIFHEKSKTTSKMIHHGVNKKQAHLLFDIYPKVEKTAELCVCNQENSIINLEDGIATIRPNLLIDNYNVVSNHSAYIGTFKEEMLFYMMSRGISRKVSLELLMRYFLVPNLSEVEKKIPKFLEEIKKL